MELTIFFPSSEPTVIAKIAKIICHPSLEWSPPAHIFLWLITFQGSVAKTFFSRVLEKAFLIQVRVCIFGTNESLYLELFLDDFSLLLI